jgi:hypothetical protein
MVEQHIAILQQWANAMQIVANFTAKARGTLWAEAVNTANNLENITANESSNKSAYEMYTKMKSKLYLKWIEFGCLGFITNQKQFKGKWKENGFKAVKVGYANKVPCGI